jgi:hypothetical protein
MESPPIPSPAPYFPAGPRHPWALLTSHPRNSYRLRPPPHPHTIPAAAQARIAPEFTPLQPASSLLDRRMAWLPSTGWRITASSASSTDSSPRAQTLRRRINVCLPLPPRYGVDLPSRRVLAQPPTASRPPPLYRPITAHSLLPAPQQRQPAHPHTNERTPFLRHAHAPCHAHSTIHRMLSDNRRAQGYTPLHLAAINNQLPIVKRLVEKGADIEAGNIVRFATQRLLLLLRRTTFALRPPVPLEMQPPTGASRPPKFVLHNIYSPHHACHPRQINC